MMSKPRLYIIAGCNGAGKTTASYTILPEILNCQEFVNADEIAKGLSPFAPENAAIPAGRLMSQRIRELLDADKTFAIETTLSTRSYAKLIKEAQSKGYYVVLIYFWLSSVGMAEQRVAHRVAEGGHGIPKDVIIRRYYQGIKNLFNLYMPIVDMWRVFDNSDFNQRNVADGGLLYDDNIFDTITYNKLLEICQKQK